MLHALGFVKYRFNPNSTLPFYTHEMMSSVLSVCGNSRYAGKETFYKLPSLCVWSSLCA